MELISLLENSIDRFEEFLKDLNLYNKYIRDAKVMDGHSVYIFGIRPSLRAIKPEYYITAFVHDNLEFWNEINLKWYDAIGFLEEDEPVDDSIITLDELCDKLGVSLRSWTHVYEDDGYTFDWMVGLETHHAMFPDHCKIYNEVTDTWDYIQAEDTETSINALQKLCDLLSDAKINMNWYNSSTDIVKTKKIVLERELK